MVAIVGLLSVAFLLGVLLLLRSSTPSRKAPTPKISPHGKEPRPPEPRATGLN